MSEKSRQAGSRPMAERLLPLPPFTIHTLQRFWSRVPGWGGDGCWLWAGLKCKYDTPEPYGRFYYANGAYCAHRCSYFFHCSVDPGPQLVLHECNTTLCVRPDHLYLGDQVANMRQSFDEGRNTHAGTFNANCKLSTREVREIRAVIGTLSNGKIGLMYGVSESAIWSIASGRSWGHLD